jgi:hypothetical protein
MDNTIDFFPQSPTRFSGVSGCGVGVRERGQSLYRCDGRGKRPVGTCRELEADSDTTGHGLTDMKFMHEARCVKYLETTVCM